MKRFLLNWAFWIALMILCLGVAGVTLWTGRLSDRLTGNPWVGLGAQLLLVSAISATIVTSSGNERWRKLAERIFTSNQHP